MNAKPVIQTVADFEQLQALEAEWWRLWERCPTSTPFQTPSWLLAWWRAFAPGELSVACARAQGRLIGIAPFYIEEQRRRLLPVGISLSDYLDVMLDAEAIEPAMQALEDFIRQTTNAGESLEFSELEPDALARRLPSPPACEEESDICSLCPVLRLPESGGLAAAIPPHRSRTLNRAWARLRNLGSAAIVEARSGSEVAEFLETLSDFIDARLDSKQLTSPMSDARVRRFQRDVAPQLHARNLLRLYGLKLDGRLIAVHYVMQHRERAYSYLTGFDLHCRSSAPGAVLLGNAIDQSLKSGLREFHFLRGAEPYKYLWGAQNRSNLRRVFRPYLHETLQPAAHTSLPEQRP